MLGFRWVLCRQAGGLRSHFLGFFGPIFPVSINAEYPERVRKAVEALKPEYDAIFASMNMPEARAAAKSAFDAGPEVFRSRPLKPECHIAPPAP